MTGLFCYFITLTAFSRYRCGEIKRLVMGLDRFQKTPCGFCFVEYYTHQDALDCMKYIGGTKLDERIIRTDLDPGFQEGRQYGYVAIKLQPNSKYLQLTGLLDVEGLEAKFEMNTEMNMTLAVEVTVALTQSKGWKKRKRMVKVNEQDCFFHSLGANMASGIVGILFL